MQIVAQIGQAGRRSPSPPRVLPRRRSVPDGPARRRASGGVPRRCAACRCPGRAAHMANTNGTPIVVTPLRTQIPFSRKHVARRMDGPVANQQHGIGRCRVGPSVRSAAAATSGSSPNRCRSRICTSATLVREPSSKASVPDLVDRHATQQLDAQHGPAAGDAGVRNDRVPRVLKALDRRDQRHVQVAAGQPIRQATGIIQNQLRVLRPLVEAINQRLRVQVRNRADPQLPRT